jgi:hypothetical protein
MVPAAATPDSAAVAAVPTLLHLAAGACANALARGDNRVVAGVGDLHRDLVEVIAIAYFRCKLNNNNSRGSGSARHHLPLPTSSCHLPALRALAESAALSPASLALSDASFDACHAPMPR